MKKILLAVHIIFIFAPLIAQQYRINKIEYDITGNITGTTREYSLSQAVEIDTERLFNSIEEFENYIDDIDVQYQNQRVLESTNIITSFGEIDAENIIPVSLLIETIDSFNIIALPYPKYDSNYGFELKLALNHYNFLGSMLPLDFDISYKHDIEEDNGIKNDDHILGLHTTFSYPFPIGEVDAEWNNSIDFSYTIGEELPDLSFSTNLTALYEINNNIAVKADVKQGMTFKPEYAQYNDEFYLTQGASLSMPVTLAKTDFFGNITWSPTFLVEYFWDPRDLLIDTNNIDLIDTTVTYQHGFSLGRVDWIGNFKDGFYASFNQSLIQNINFRFFSVVGEVDFQYFKAFEHLGIKSRAYLFSKDNSTDELGSRVRGIQNNDIDTNSAIIINFDLPIKVWQTDWVGYGLWDWTRYIDFEMQISPFIDFALAYNKSTGTTYSIKDGWYGAGLEILGYLNAARSVVGRISGGIDIVQFADKVGNRISFVDTAVNKLFTTDWRKDNWYEFSFGIGLFY